MYAGVQFRLVNFGMGQEDGGVSRAFGSQSTVLVKIVHT